MSEEFGGFGIEQGGGSESVSEVSQEDIARVNERARKAAQAGATKKQQSQRDNQNAKLLSLLLKYINDEELIHHISYQLVDLKIGPEIIVGEFLPILKEYVNIDPVKPLYEDVWAEQQQCLCRGPEEIVQRYKILFKMYDELQDMDPEYKVSLVTARCKSFGYTSVTGSHAVGTDTKNQQMPIEQWVRKSF